MEKAQAEAETEGTAAIGAYEEGADLGDAAAYAPTSDWGADSTWDASAGQFQVGTSFDTTTPDGSY